MKTTWAGHDDDGTALPDGVYSLRADATSADGKARAATATLRLDTVPPRVESVAIAPDPFSPNGDGQRDVARLDFVPSQSALARVSVVAADGTALRRVTGWKAVTASAQRVTWDGRVSSTSGLKPAPEGEAILLLELRDGAGNRTEAQASGDGGPDPGADVGVAEDALSQRRRGARRGHALVQADASGGRDRDRRPFRLHGENDPARQAGLRSAVGGVGRQARRRRYGRERRVLLAGRRRTARSA